MCLDNVVADYLFKDSDPLYTQEKMRIMGPKLA